MPRSAHRWLAALVPIAVTVFLVGAVVGNPDLRALVGEAWGRVRWQAVLAVIPAQILANILYTGALDAMRPGVSARASFVSRLIRDAGCNLLVLVSGLGEAIGARVLVLLGARPRAAITATALDSLAEGMAQIPFMLLSLAVLPRFWSLMRLPGLPGLGVIAAAAVLAALIAGVAIWARRHGRSRLLRRLRAEYRLLRREIRRRHGGFPRAIVCHFFGWAMGGVQLWIAARVLGIPLAVFAAVSTDAVAYAARGIGFFVPAGLVLQEAGLVGAGLVFGLAAPQALALALVLRLRDLVLGSSLLGWPLLEWRRRPAQVNHDAIPAGL